MRPVLLIFGLLAALLGALAATPSLIALPPAPTAPAPKGEFDASRAKARLAAILGDQRPHPADSFANDSVRSRLVGQIRALGLTPIMRNQFACNEIHKQRGVTCARVRNVIVALGPADGKALLLNAHYDSTSVGPGAADDGAGVATLLEVAAILKSERLERPVILLFNEGEELGLVGARAFLSDPISRRVDSLVNLEARGTTGPVTMFETSEPNGPAVRAFARAVDRPYANSLATDFYRQLPNYTDVNSFAERGWMTLNLAMIGNESRYHSPGDDLAALDVASLKHMGDQALGLARELQTGAPGGASRLLFADLAGRHLVVVPFWLGLLLLALLGGGFAWVSVQRRGTLRGVGTTALALTGAAALSALGLFLVSLARPGAFWRGHPGWTELAMFACALVAAVASIAMTRLDRSQLRAAFWLAFLLLGGAVLLVAPGGLVYFLLPPIAALSGIIARWERIGALAGAALLWLTLGEVIALLGDLLSNGPFFILAPLAALVALPWLIEAKPLLDRVRRAAIAASALLAAGSLAIVASVPAYTTDRQQRFTIEHVTLGNRAFWSVANDGAPLPQAYGDVTGWRWSELPFLPRARWVAPAPAIDVTPPRITPVSNVRRGGLRTVTYHVDPNGADSVTLVAPADSAIVSAGSDGFVRPIRGREGAYRLRCFGRSCAGATMQFVTRRAGPVEFAVIGSRSGLPRQAKPLLAARPRFARPQYAADSTLAIARVAL